MSEEKKLIDEEILKSLECCSKNNPDCDNCPCAVGGGSLCRHPEQQALDLINRLQDEIELLKKRHGVALLRNDDLDLENYELKKQVDELNKKIIARRTEFNNFVIVEKDKSVKTTAKEILVLAEDYNYGYEPNMANFILALKERYGVEVE